MDTLTTLPFQVLFLIAVASMGLPVYQINRRNVGTLRIDAHLIKPSAWRSAFRAQLSAWRAMFARLVPIAAATVLMLALAHALPDQFDVAMAAAPVLSIKALKQARADNDRDQAALRAEGRTLMAVAEPTEAQKTRIAEISAQLDAKANELEDITAKIALAEKFADEERAQASHVVAGQDRAELQPWGPEVASNAPAREQERARIIGLGEFAQAVKAAATGTGMDVRLQAAAAGHGVGVGADGGFAVPNELAAGIEREMFEVGELLSRVDVREISGNAITYNVFDETSRADGSRQGGVLGYWVDEGTAPDATKIRLAQMEMKLRKVAALGYMTEELEQDAAALGGELNRSFADELVFQVENKIYRGIGAGSPLGFLNAPCLVSVAKESGQAADTINTKNLSKMWARMPAREQMSAVWLVNVDCQPQLDQLAHIETEGIMQPRFVNYGPDGVLTIKGRPVIPVEYAETLGDQGDIALVSLRRYRLIRKGGVQQNSSIHVRFTQGENTYRAIYRVDGQPVPRAAITPFKGTNTLSPFVVLDARA